MDMNWTEQAARAAEYASDEMFHEHRGAMRWKGAIAIFGNDGYRQDERSRIQVEVLRQLLEECGVEEFGFAVDDRPVVDGQAVSERSRGYSWAMIVEDAEIVAGVDDLHQMVWEAHRIAHSAVVTDPLYAEWRKVQDASFGTPPANADEIGSDSE